MKIAIETVIKANLSSVWNVWNNPEDIKQWNAGEDHAILAARHALYATARELNPARWSGKTRDWSPVGAVTLNPERDCIIKAHLGNDNIQPLAA